MVPLSTVDGGADSPKISARWDWYSATIRDDLDTVLGELSDCSTTELREVGKGLHGYANQHELVGPFGVEARILSGGANVWPHVQVSGDDCPHYAGFIRSRWPERHSVARMDSALDFDSEGAWDTLLGVVQGVAVERGLRVDQQGDWMRGELGRTFYVGSRKSPVMCRLYEKGKQLREKVENPDAISADWVRLELQVRPGRESKWAASKVTEEEAWGFSQWSRELLKRCVGTDVEHRPVNVWRETDDERALRFMAMQYGRALERLRGRLGTWEDVGVEIGRLVAKNRPQGHAQLGKNVPAPGDDAADLIEFGGVSRWVPRDLPAPTEMEKRAEREAKRGQPAEAGEDEE